jgi:hypothetical protein
MPLDTYWHQIEKALQTGDATEHTHRPALAQLIQRLQPDALAINEPKRIVRLKDRRGRTLSNAEIQTYRQIVYALSETLRLMERIDLCWRAGALA